MYVYLDVFDRKVWILLRTVLKLENRIRIFSNHDVLWGSFLHTCRHGKGKTKSVQVQGTEMNLEFSYTVRSKTIVVNPDENLEIMFLCSSGAKVK